jgi:hypothetical protein
VDRATTITLTSGPLVAAAPPGVSVVVDGTNITLAGAPGTPVGVVAAVWCPASAHVAGAVAGMPAGMETAGGAGTATGVCTTPYLSPACVRFFRTTPMAVKPRPIYVRGRIGYVGRDDNGRCNRR